MKINWFTVLAQVINFLILVWLLKRFLYKPILNAIDEREKKITSQLKDADDKKTEAKKEQEGFRKKKDDLDKQKKELMDIAVADANTERGKLIVQAKDEAGTLRLTLERAASENQENQNLETARKIQKEVFAITRKALTDIASLSLEEHSVSTFIKRLNESKHEEKKQFIEAFTPAATCTNSILVRSAFDLPVKQQDDINRSVNEILGIKTQLQFKTSPEIISGIELTTNGYKLAWSFSEYLISLEKSISDNMKEEVNGEPGPGKKMAPVTEAEKIAEPGKR
jgi:F-type H+-transporting ATPase subunit b